MPSPSLLLLLLHHHFSPLSPRLASSRHPSPSLKTLAPTPTPRFLLPLRLPPRASRRGRGRGGVCAAADEDGRIIPIVRCYEGGLARLELSGAARREQAVAAAAAADGGAAAEAHLAAGAEAMVLEAFLPGADGGERSAVSTRVILQAKEVKEKASKIKKDFGADFFSENEPDSDSILAMAFKQIVMEQLSNFPAQRLLPRSRERLPRFEQIPKGACGF